MTNLSIGHMTSFTQRVAQQGSQNSCSALSHCSLWPCHHQDHKIRYIVCTSSQVCHSAPIHWYRHRTGRRVCCSCLAWLSVQPCWTETVAAADGGLKKEDLQGLERSSIFLFILHSPNPIAAPLFAPCSTQRLYLHEYADFEGISDVSPRLPHLATYSLASTFSGNPQDMICVRSSVVGCVGRKDYLLSCVPASVMYA